MHTLLLRARLGRTAFAGALMAVSALAVAATPDGFGSGVFASARARLAVPAGAAPANDALASATVIASLPYSGTTSNVGATVEAGEATDYQNGPRRVTLGATKSVWWTFTPATTGTYAFDLAGSAFTPHLSFWTGSGHPLAFAYILNRQLEPVVNASLQGGTTYYIRAASPTATDEGTLSLAVTAVPAPANDALADATPVASLPYYGTGSNLGATKEANEDASGSGDESAWWTFTPSETATYVVSLEGSTTPDGSDLDTYLSLWTGSAHPLALVEENDDAPGAPWSRITRTLTAGTPYRIRASGYDRGVMGRLKLLVAKSVPNDALAGATVIAALPYSGTGTNAGTTTEGGEQHRYEVRPGVFETLGATKSVWWTFTPAATGTYTFDLAGSAFTPRLSLWTGTAHPLALANVGNTSLGTTVNALLTGGTKYYVRLASAADADEGALALAVSRAARPTGDDLADALVVGALPFSQTASNVGATGEANEAIDPNGDGSTNAIWWTFTPATTGTYQVDLAGTRIDAMVSVWSGSAHPLTFLANEDDEAKGVRVALTAGTAYRIRASGWTNDDSGDLTLHVAAKPGPPNDDRAYAPFTTAVPATFTGSTVGATTESGEAAPACAANAAGSVWYHVYFETAGTYLFNTAGSSFNTVVTLHDATGTELACNDTYKGSAQAAVRYTVNANTRFYVRVAGATPADAGALRLNVAAAPNDDRADALPVATGETNWDNVYANSNAAATSEPGETASSCAADAGTSVWWTIPASGTGFTSFMLDTRPTAFNTTLSLWEEVGGSLREVGCNDDAPTGGRTTSRMRVRLDKAKAYFVRVAGKGASDKGDVSLVERAAINTGNDSLAYAQVIRPAYDLGAALATTTHGGTRESGEPRASCTTSTRGSSWMRFTPAATGTYTLTTSGHDGGVATAVWSGADFGSMREVGCLASTSTAAKTAVLDLTAGTTYYLQSVGTTFNSEFSLALGRSNDGLVFATPLVLGDTLDVNTESARLEPNEAQPASCAASTGSSVWYTFTPATTGNYVVAMRSAFASVVSVWTGSAHPLAPVACRRVAAGAMDSTLVRLTAGTAYKVRVSGEGADDVGTARLVVSRYLRPLNDDFATALPFTLPATVTGSNAGATLEAGEPAVTCNDLQGNASTVWWTFVVPAGRPGQLRVSTEGTAFSHQFAVFADVDGQMHANSSLCSARMEGMPVAFVAPSFPSLERDMTLYVRVAGLAPADTGAVRVDARWLDRPANDVREGATLLAGTLPMTLRGDIGGATNGGSGEGHPPTCNFSGATVWYRYQPTVDGELSVDVSTEYNTRMGVDVLKGNEVLGSVCKEAAISRPAKDSDAPAAFGAQGAQAVTIPVVAGETYDIRVDAIQPATFALDLAGPSALPVELVGFSGTVSGRTARLAWTTVTETNNAGFVVERKTGETWTDASGLIAGHGTSTERHDYAFEVERLVPGSHTFRLRQTDTDGAVQHSAPVSVEVGVDGAAALTLLGRRAVRVSVARAQAVRVELFDVLGRRVATLYDGEVEKHHDVALPEGLASGLYVVRATGEGFDRAVQVVR